MGASEAPQPPLRHPFAGRPAWELFVRAWRPAAAWICVLILLVRGAALPIVEMARGLPVSAFDWMGFGGLFGALGFGVLRSFDKAKETA